MRIIEAPNSLPGLKMAVAAEIGAAFLSNEVDELLEALVAKYVPSVAWSWLHGQNHLAEARPIDLIKLGRLTKAIEAVEAIGSELFY